MFKIYALICVIFVFISCNDKKPKKVYSTNPKDINLEKGKSLYFAKCMICHKKDGKGFGRIYPPLANADFLENNIQKSLCMVKNGGSEKITVNGLVYQSYMPSASMSETDLVHVFNYILNAWGNKYGSISIEQVRNCDK